MSHDHHSHSLDQMLAAQVDSLITARLEGPLYSGKIKSEILDELGRACLQLSSAHDALIDVSKFIVKPRKLSDGSCVALVNKTMPYVGNAYQLVVAFGNLSIREERHLVIYKENPHQLDRSIYHKTTAEQYSEIIRQLLELSNTVQGFTLPAVFTVLFFEKEIEGYEYVEPEVCDPVSEHTHLFPVGQGATTTVVETPVDKIKKVTDIDSRPTKRGPTLAPMSR